MFLKILSLMFLKLVFLKRNNVLGTLHIFFFISNPVANDPGLKYGKNLSNFP